MAMLLATAEVCHRRGELDEAQRLDKEALALIRQHVSPGHYLVRSLEVRIACGDWYRTATALQRATQQEAESTWSEADELEARGEHEQALTKLRIVAQMYAQLAYPTSSPTVWLNLNTSNVLRRLNRWSEALPYAEAGLKISRDCDGEISPLTTEAWLELGDCRFALGRYDEGLRASATACRILWACRGEESGRYAEALRVSGRELIALRDFDRAERCVADAERICRKLGAEGTAALYSTVSAECVLLSDQNKDHEALVKADELLKLAKDFSAGRENPEAEAQLNKAEILLTVGETDAASQLVDDAETALQGQPVLVRVHCLATRGRVLLAQSKFSEATAILQQAIATEQAEVGAESPGLRHLLRPYATALRGCGHEAEASVMETRLDKIMRNLSDMAAQARTDPQCKLPWER
jgi:tetratricopeptide (TPR) repeat protein